MEKDHVVSLWLGRATSADDFWNALEVEFSEDGDFVGSAFSKAFGIEYYEDGLREAQHFHGPVTSFTSMAAGASYQDVVLPRFVGLGVDLDTSTNCLVFLYNYDHNLPMKASLPGLELRFIGSVSYLSD